MSMSDDELNRMLSGALGSQDAPGGGTRQQLGAAIERGRSLRRRRLTVASLVSVLVVGLGGLVAVAAVGGDEERISTVDSIDGTTAPTVAPATTPATTTPASSVPQSTPEPATPASTQTTAPPTARATVPPTAVPPTVAPPPTVNSVRVGTVDMEFSSTGAPDGAGDIFFAFPAGSGVEVWTPGGRIASLSSPGCDDRSLCDFTDLAHDDTSVWVTLDLSEPRTDGFVGSYVLRADMTTGGIEVVHSAADGNRVEALDIAGDGRVLAWEVPPADVPAPRTSSILALRPGQPAEVLSEQILKQFGVGSGVFSPDGQRFAFSLANPQTGSSEIQILDIVTGQSREYDTTRATDPSGVTSPFFPLVEQWIGSTSTLLIAEGWEDSGYGLLDTTVDDLDAAISSFTSPDFTWDTEDACVFDDGTMAIGRWAIPYAEGAAEPGDIGLVGPDGSSIRDLGLGVAAIDMTCLGDGRIVLLALDESGDQAAPRRLLLVDTAEGVQDRLSELAVGDYRTRAS